MHCGANPFRSSGVFLEGIHMFRVKIQSDRGTDLGSFDLPGDQSPRPRLLIGRAEDCDLRIRHSSISRHHCSIERDEDGDWILRDLGSTLGTVVQDARVSQATIENGLQARLGPAVLKFELVPAPVRHGPGDAVA
jgi:pSer/pThr/pTyr-binding forkhead associated (FHA) protein